MAHDTVKAFLVSLERNQTPNFKKDETNHLPSAPTVIRKGALDDIANLVALKEGETLLKQDEPAILPWLSTDSEAVATPRPGVVKTVAGNTPTRIVKGSEHLYPKDVSTRIVLPFDRTDSSAADLAQGHT